jgi:hypothetical protein
MVNKNQKKLKGLSVKQYERLLADIQKLNSGLDFDISLSPAERRNIPKMGDKTLPFVDKALNYATQFPNMVPPFLDMKQFQKNYKLANQLHGLLMEIMPVVEKISDTYYRAGAEAFLAARQIYAYAKYASNGGEAPAGAIVDDLKKRYEKRPRKTKTEKKNPPTTQPTKPESDQ